MDKQFYILYALVPSRHKWFIAMSSFVEMNMWLTPKQVHTWQRVSTKTKSQSLRQLDFFFLNNVRYACSAADIFIYFRPLTPLLNASLQIMRKYKISFVFGYFSFVCLFAKLRQMNEDIFHSAATIWRRTNIVVHNYWGNLFAANLVPNMKF